MRRTGLLVGVLATMLAAGSFASAQDPDEKLKQRVEKIDEKLSKAVAELATKYSDDGDVEAAHFFAEFHRGLGKKDDKIQAIWLDWELKVYLGKDQGGKPLDKAAPIGQKMSGVEVEYKKFVEETLAAVKKDRRAFTKTEGELFRGCVVKYELARSAAEYIKTIKRINELRKSMGLRGVLWDFENSRKLILAAGCWSDVLDTLGNVTDKNKESPYYSDEAMKLAIDEAAYGYGGPADWLEHIRGYAFSRAPLLNPNARRLWLGHWKRFDGFVEVSTYVIPQIPYREDIPTPSQRYERETVTKDWVDTEETLEVGNRKVPLVRYPTENEKDSAWSFGAPGKADLESGWGKSEHEFLRKAGVPVMLRLFGSVKLTDIEARFVTKGGKEVSCRTYTNGDDRVPGMGEWPTVLIVPESQLERGATYTVTIKAKASGSAFEKTWSFTTRAGK